MKANENCRVWKNYNAFYRQPGEVEDMNCEVCGSACSVKRGVVGATGFASGMAGKKTEHDYFYCCYNDELWHWVALGLMQELNDTMSPSLKELIQKDIDNLLEEKPLH